MQYTFDIDAMDYSIAAGTGSPMFGGFYYDEMNEILELLDSFLIFLVSLLRKKRKFNKNLL